MAQIQIQIWREEYNELLREKEAIQIRLNGNIGKKQEHIQKLKEINKKINYFTDIISKTLMNSYKFPFVVDVEDLDSNFKYKKCDFEFRRRPIITSPQNRRQKQKDSDLDYIKEFCVKFHTFLKENYELPGANLRANFSKLFILLVPIYLFNSVKKQQRIPNMYKDMYRYSMGDYGILKFDGYDCSAVYLFDRLIWEFPDYWEYTNMFCDDMVPINQPQWHGKAFNYYWNEYVNKTVAKKRRRQRLDLFGY